MQHTVKDFGHTKDLKKVHSIVLAPQNECGGFEVEILTYGATVRCIKIPIESGNRVDVALGGRTIADYETSSVYMGGIVGRVANRIRNGKFKLNGIEYKLAVNNGPNHLHGGLRGFDKHVWNILNHEPDSVTMCHVSEADDEGYPGRVLTNVTYKVSKSANAMNLSVIFNATCTKETPINLSSHTYFNLCGDNSGNGGLKSHTIQSPCGSYLPVDQNHLVTGEIRSTTNSEYDFSKPKNLGDAIEKMLESQEFAFDNYFCMPTSSDTQMKTVFTAVGTSTGISMDVRTTNPGFQFYTADYLENHPSKYDDFYYGKRSAFCVEAQGYPDAVNHPTFPSIILSPGKVYEHSIEYCFHI